MVDHDSVVTVGNWRGAFWPSPLQAELLVVALEDRPDTAIETWRKIRPCLLLDKLEPGSFELLPLIYRNLTLGGHDEPELPRMRGIYRRTWVANNLLAERTKESAQVLEVAGIPALFIEGVVVAARFYPELGLRPTSFVDVLVDDDDAVVALAHLTGLGWKEGQGAMIRRPGELRYLSDKSGNVCVLRSKLGIDCIRSAACEKSYAPLGKTEERYDLGGIGVRVPTPTETLFAVCVSHARIENPPNIQWIADAKMVLSAKIDWQRFLALAYESGQVLRLAHVLEYLGRLPGPKPPQEVHDVLATTKLTKRERLSYLCTTGSFGRVGAMPTLVAEQLGATANKSVVSTIATFPSFLSSRWGLAHPWQVPIAAGRRTLRLLRARRGTA